MESLEASGRINGYNAFCHIPRIFMFQLNANVELKAIYATLSRKLTEGKIIIADNDNLKDFNY